MKQGYTDIILVLDRSGSMQQVRDDTIGGFNSFLADQQKVGGEATITLVQFNDVIEVLYSAMPIANAKPLTRETFVPSSVTALLDAIGFTITEAGKRLEALSESQRPEKVIFVVLTDGLENSSSKFDAHQVNDLITHQRDVYKWEFLFLGANQDAITTASQMGIQGAHAMTYAANSVGTKAVCDVMSANIRDVRRGVKTTLDWSDEDREIQKKAGAWKPSK